MKVVNEFPRQVKVLDPVYIPMSDGVNLAARIWLPEDAEASPVPAILEFLPYRRRDGTATRDALNHPYFAGHGYAGVRVDIRGSGDSDGVLEDEYLKQEQDDAIEIIEWLARQPWCSGAVGMIGISWGGFNGLQVAARQPEALKAVISICSTDDRYADDIHHMGGCLLLDKLEWSSVMFSHLTLPPDPDIVGERWRELWMQRLEGSGLWLETWLRHQRRDAFYKHGSVCEDYDAIKTPIYAVGGWADGYSNAIFRLLANLKAPCKGLVGPWAHCYPHYARPGPAIGFLQECLRWWDHWLKGEDTGIMDEPALRVWMQDPVHPAPDYDERPGRWVAEESWPSSRIEQRPLYLNRHELSGEAGDETPLAISSPETIGIAAGRWCPYGEVPDQACDQREEAGGSLVFDTDPLTEAVEILGAPVLELDVSCDRENGIVAVRLDEVMADGAVARVTYGLLNLTHRDSHEFPEPLEPGERYRVRIQLNDIAHRFEPGNRIRVAVSSAYWPVVWPSPAKTTLTVMSGASRLLLPVRPERPDDASLPAFAEPESAPPLEKRELQGGSTAITREQDYDTGITAIDRWVDEGITYLEPFDIEIGDIVHHRFSIHPDEPLSARGETVHTSHYGRDDWQVVTQTSVILTSDADRFRIQAELDAYEGETRVFCKSWDVSIDRDLV